VQCATGTPASMAWTAMWNLQLADSKGADRVRIPPSPPVHKPFKIKHLGHFVCLIDVLAKFLTNVARFASIQVAVGCPVTFG
jgi:hypothetical protein